MDKSEIEKKRKDEETARSLFNKENRANTRKKTLQVGSEGAKHEFDLYESGRFIGGITTSPWKCKTEKRSNNSGGQDRVSAELLWLTLWSGKERRVMILTDGDMADRLYKRWKGCAFPKRIDIIHCDLNKGVVPTIGTL